MKEERWIQDLVAKYLAGTCTEQEKQIVEEWYAASEDQPNPLLQLSDEDKLFLKHHIFQKINERTGRKYARIRFSSPWVRYVAAIAAVVIVVFGLKWFNVLQDGKEGSSDGGTSKTIAFVNNGKSVLVKKLPDGSVVSLYPGSRIAYLENNGKSREVTLHGEAFFDVYRDTERPFTVFSKHLRTKVLGTSFRVRAWDSDRESVVGVRSGTVSVRRMTDPASSAAGNTPAETGREVLLQKGQSVVVTNETMLEPVKTEKKETALGVWKTSNLSFENVPVSEVVEKLNGIYDVRIEVASAKINSYVLRADLTGMNLNDILEILENSLGLSYRMDKDRIVLSVNVK